MNEQPAEVVSAAEDAEVMAVSQRLIERNREAYEALAE